MSSKKILLSNFSWKFAERICAQIVTFVVSIILARLLSPDDDGAIALVTVFITLANVLVSDGLGSALIQKKEVDTKDYSTIFYANLAMSVMIYFLLFFGSPLIAKFYNMPILDPATKVLALKVPLAAINSVQQAYVSRHMIFKKFFFSTIIGTLASAVVGIVMAYTGFGIWSLVAQYLFNSVVDTIVLWITVKWRPTKEFSIIKLKQLLSYGWKILAVGLLTSLYNEIRTLIIGKVYSSSDLAYYERGNKFPHIFITNVNAAITSVLFPFASRVQDNRIKLKQYTKLSISVGAYVMSPLMIGLACTSDSVVRLLLTEKWIDCIPYLRIFCIAYLLIPMQTANIQAIKASGRSDIYLKIEMIKKIIGLLLLAVAIPFGVKAIAISAAISSFVNSVVNAFPNRKLLDYSYFEQVQDLAPSIAMSIAMGILVWSASYLNLNIILQLVVQLFIGVTSYVLLSVLFKNKNFFMLWGIAKEVLLKKRGASR